MSLQDLGSIGEFIAAIATIVTLAYLALQIRNSNRTAQAATTLDVSRMFAEWHRGLSQSPDLGSILFKGVAEPDLLSDEEMPRFNALIAELFIVFEAINRQYLLGFVTEEAWRPFEKKIFELLSNPHVQEWWASEVSTTSETFRKFVDEKRNEYGVLDDWAHRMKGVSSAPAK